MAEWNASHAVTQNRDSDLRSALVTAMDQWTEPYDIRPQGVFGSLARVISGGVSISSETLDLEFTIPFDDDLEPNEAEIIFYNLSDSTIEHLKQDAAITVEAGYQGDTGIIFNGFISTVKTTWDGADKVTTVKALDDVADHTIESISYAEGTSASYILKELIGKTGLPVAVFEVRRDHTYEDSQTVDGDLMQNIKKYAQVCGISVYVSKGQIYARYLKDGDNLNFTLSPDTGLIGYPEPYAEEIRAEDVTETIEGYEAEMLLQHRVYTGAIITLSSKVAKGTFRVCSGEHIFNESEAVTKVRMY